MGPVAGEGGVGRDAETVSQTVLSSWPQSASSYLQTSTLL